ncbi:MAG: phage tail family protein, partial [Methanobrevibacter sp.]|nr:phage tail family protein [Methanobrevibacter sp.]
DSNLNMLTVDINEEFELDLNFEGYDGEYVRLYGYKVDDVNGELYFNDISSDIKIYVQSFWRSITYFQPETVPGGFQGNVPFNFPMDGTVQNRFRIEAPGTYSILVYGDSLLKRINIHVRPDSEDLSDPSFTIFKLGQEEINRLGHGYNYTVSSLIKLITPESFIRDWRKNYRIGVFNNINPNIDTSNTIIESEEIYDSENNSTDEVSVEEIESEIVDGTDYENLSDLEIFRYAEYWSDVLLKNEGWVDLSVEFPYNEAYPVYIILTGDYPESVNCTENVLHFTEPCVIESTVYHGREPNGNFPTPIVNTIINEDLSEIVLKLYEQSNSFVTYQLPLDEGFSVSDTFAITGIEVACDIEYTDQCVLSAKLIDQDKNSSSRSIILNDIDENEDNIGTFVLGGRYDRWGFKSSELQNLEKWQIEFALNNIFENSNNEAIVKFKNIQLIIYTQIVKSNFYKVFVEDENVRHLGMFVKKVIVPEGLKTETKYLNIDGSDINDAYRMNVDKKEIEIEFSIRGCNLEETTNMLRQLAKLFTNKRDDLNRPIPKRIEFAHYPDVYFEYILQEPFDSDPAITDYDSKLKLIVPAGTAFAKKDTVSNVSGANQGIAKVNPIITFIPTGDVVEISETINNQYFKISESDWSSENTVEIDCNTRKITILDYVDDETGMTIKKDISESGDLNNDWFVLHEDYSFEANNAIIQTVSFKERW